MKIISTLSIAMKNCFADCYRPETKFVIGVATVAFQNNNNLRSYCVGVVVIVFYPVLNQVNNVTLLYNVRLGPDANDHQPHEDTLLESFNNQKPQLTATLSNMTPKRKVRCT